ncbi:MAG: T9SS type A sorting domain-containing protein [Candidatus Cloacimonetes bacterium]|nr:T9SS type A sorting domain-containing protein [Candidatus Cloacimonadota bacterium]
MKRLVISIFVIFIVNCNAYDWVEISDFNEPVWKYFKSDNYGYQVVGVDEGLYLNVGLDWEYYPRGFRVFDIVDLDSNTILVADADGSCQSAGLWEFEFETADYDIVFFTWHGVKILHCNQNYYFIAGDYWQSFDGYDWNYYNYWDSAFIVSIAAFENNVVLSTEENIYVSDDEGITFNQIEQTIENIADLVFSSDGLLYGRTPWHFEDSIIWVSDDFGASWSELFHDSYIGRIGVDSAGKLFVGWRGYPENLSGIAYWDEQEQELVYMNSNLPNLEINRIEPFEYEGNPSVVCCTQEGIFYLTDYAKNSDDELSLDEISLSLSNYPNPFNPQTSIIFTILKESRIELTIYNTKGQRIKSLLKDNFAKGKYSIIWTGDDELGNSVSSGIYFYKLNVDSKNEIIRKCLLLK